MNQNSMKLGTEKINKLLVQLSLPATVGMVVSALYNLIDTIFIGRGVGTNAIGGLTIVFPVQLVMMSFGLLIGIGASSTVSRALGAKDMERVNDTVGNSYGSVLFLSILMTIIGFVFMDPLLKIFGATDTLLPYAKEYMSVILIGSIFFISTMTGNNLIRSEGNAKAAMLSMVIGTVINIALDPIFIFVFKMGIKGAAWATVIAQFVSFVYVVIYLFGKNSVFNVTWHNLKLKKDIMREIITVGMSSFARQIAGSIVAVVLNNSLKFYGGDLSIAVYGVVNRVLSFLFMPLFGVVQGMQPIVGYNYGAKKTKRIHETVKLSVLVTVVLSTICVVFAEIFPHAIIGIFSQDQELINESAWVLRIILMMLPVIGIQVVGGALFQALGKATPALILTLLRQVILFIPLLIILPKIFGIMGIWITYPISDGIATVVTAILLIKEMKKIEVEFS